MLLSLAKAVDVNSVVVAVRDVPWIGNAVNVIHVLALTVFGGALLIVDLRLLGTGLTREPLAKVAAQARPWLLTGFFGLIATGIPQLALQPLKGYGSEFFHWKMEVMFVAIIFTFVVRPRVLQIDERRLGPMWGRLTGIASLALWTVVVVAARLIAFQ